MAAALGCLGSWITLLRARAVPIWRSPALLGAYGVPLSDVMRKMTIPLPSLPLLAEPNESADDGNGAKTTSNKQATEVLSHWCDFLRPREFSVRLDVKMKRGAAPYPRNPYKKRPVPKVKGIIRKLIK
mmetsp:Transcript_121522/g.170978  ORF Transcript_121522/g.170978 Transcript_121522/m.170978 type:complete len:128 (-) Transcript_121522:44-427(-)